MTVPLYDHACLLIAAMKNCMSVTLDVIQYLFSRSSRMFTYTVICTINNLLYLLTRPEVKIFPH